VNGGLIRRSGLIAAALSLTLLFGADVFLDSGSSARASDSETAALIDDINSYRTSHGIAPLAVSGSANADAQAAAQGAVDACGYNYGLNGHNSMLVSYGFETADNTSNGPGIFPAWESDTYYNGEFSNPSYGSVGIGRAKSSSCTQWGYLWVAYFDTGGGPATTPPPTPLPTPTPSPTPTNAPTPTSTPAPTATSPPSGSHTPTSTAAPTGHVSPTPTPTPSVSPAATTPAVMPGDVDCGGTINMEDVILLLEAAANVPAFAPCMHLAGIDCTGGVDAADALVLLEFLENIPYRLPDGCPPLGSPAPSPTLGPSKTPTPTPGVTPISAGINHCQLAMVAYQLDTAESMNGEESCTPVPGTAYDCAFSTADHKAVCGASPSDFPDYTCSFTSAGFADCLPSTEAPKYLCFDDGAHMVECLPTQAGYASYDCAVNGSDVTCTSDAPAPDFACRREGATFSCLALASATPTASPG
jgi:hypothetical protein